MKEQKEAIELMCPKCGHTLIIYTPGEDIPKCPKCNTQMLIKELLKEGKSF